MAALFLRSVAVIPRTQNKKFWITFRHLCSHRIMFARTSLVNNEKSKGPAASIPLTLILFHLTAMQEIQWCFEKRAKLSLKVFADHFGYMDKTTANSRYINILQSAVMVEKGAQLMNDFKTWKGSSHELDYWRNKSVEEARKDTAAGLTKTSLRSMKRIGENEEDEVVRKARRMSNDEKPAANVTEEIVTTPPAPLSSTPKQELVGDTWDLHTETEFWCDWMMLIESNQVLHNFDLQRYHVIECGYKIKCRPNIDEDLYNRLGLLKHKTNVNKENRDYIKACFAAKQISIEAFLEKTRHITSFRATESTAMVATVFKQFAKRVFVNNGERISKSEIAYNHWLVWPLIEAAVDEAKPKTLFLPGEILLSAFNDLDTEYKADGIIFHGDYEIGLLETSGVGFSNIPEYSYPTRYSA